IVGVLRELGTFRAPAAGIALAGALGAAVSAHQVSGAWEVYQSYLGFSDSLDWVSRNCHGQRVLFTFNVSDHFSTWKDSPEQLMDTCLVSPAPLWIFGAGPAHAAALKKAKPLHSWPSYWGTENAYIELKGFGNPDWRNGDLNSAVRVYRLGDVYRPLPIESIAADSAVHGWTPDKIFFAGKPGKKTEVRSQESEENTANHGADAPGAVRSSGASGRAAWRSEDGPGPHYVEVFFGEPAKIGAAILLNRSDRQLRELGVWGRIGARWEELFFTDSLKAGPRIEASWHAVNIDGIRFAVRTTTPGCPKIGRASCRERGESEVDG